MRRETPVAMAMSTLYRWLGVQNQISLISRFNLSYCMWEERGMSLCTFGHFVSDTGFCRIFATQPKFEKQKVYCVPYMEVNVCTAGAINVTRPLSNYVSM